MSYKNIVMSYEEFCKKSKEQLQEELTSVIHKVGVAELSEKTGLSKECLYRYCKKCFLTQRAKLDFIVYCKIMMYAENEKKDKRRLKKNAE